VAVDLGNRETLIYGGQDLSRPKKPKPHFTYVHSKIVKEGKSSKSVSDVKEYKIEHLNPHPFVVTDSAAILISRTEVHKFDRKSGTWSFQKLVIQQEDSAPNATQASKAEKKRKLKARQTPAPKWDQPPSPEAKHDTKFIDVEQMTEIDMKRF
jgi:hypothetical protein